jgi:hypothetical protein
MSSRPTPNRSTFFSTRCNNKFGGSIDAALSEQVAEFRNLLQMQSGAGNPPPTIRNLKAGDKTVSLASDGRPKLKEKPFTIEKLADGVFSVDMKVESIEELEKHIPNIAAALRMPETAVRAMVGNAGASFVAEPTGHINLPLRFGGSAAVRSIVKSCLVLWATLVGRVEVRGAPYAAAAERTRIIADVLDRRLEVGAVATEETVKALTREIAERLVSISLGATYERPISQEELRAMLASKK